jgi:hypothetical protein
MRAIGCAAGIVGGACWLVGAFLDGGAADLLWYVGLVLVAVAVLVAGLSLVPRSPLWLRAIVGGGSLALAGSVLFTVRSEGDETVVDAVAGGLVAVVAAVVLLRNRPERSPRSQGAHSR